MSTEPRKLSRSEISVQASRAYIAVYSEHRARPGASKPIAERQNALARGKALQAAKRIRRQLETE